MIELEIIGSPDDVDRQVQALTTLLNEWGAEPTVEERTPTTADTKTDPVAIAALILSIPAAILAVADLGERIAKRRRADALIDCARNQPRVSIVVKVADGVGVDLAATTSDRLLDEVADAHD